MWFYVMDYVMFYVRHIPFQKAVIRATSPKPAACLQAFLKVGLISFYIYIERDIEIFGEKKRILIMRAATATYCPV